MTIAVSMGDPAGVGREIAIKAWNELKNYRQYRFVIFGDFAAFSKIAIDAPLKRLNTPSDNFDFANEIGIYEPAPLSEAAIFGAPNKAHAPQIIEYIESATNAVIMGDCSAICTLPIAKAPLYEAGFQFAGHTEFVAKLCEGLAYNGARGPIMMLMIDGLRVALTTIHIPLAKVASTLSADIISNTIIATHECLQRDFGIARPRIGVLGLNPHAGEDGKIGTEEAEIINPLCAKLRTSGIDCSDAIPADSAFAPFMMEKFDAYVAMYHDQGLIPIKALDFWGGVNVTLGLPIIRTSPDHGTGFAIAGKGIANPQSFINAIKAAKLMADMRGKNA